MGRTKGSKNKPKALDIETIAKAKMEPTHKWGKSDEVSGLPIVKPESRAVPQANGELVGNASTLALIDLKTVKRTRKPKPVTVLDKLKAAGISLEDLRALLQAPVPDSNADAKAALRKEMNAPLSAAETKQLRKQATEEMSKVKPPQLIVDEAVAQVIVPNWDKTPSDAAGLKHFLVKTIRNGGDAVSFNKELWDKALKDAKVRGLLTACKPEGSAEVDPQAKQGGGSTSLWRVMIG